jgi:hypothetical protein
MIDKRLGEKNPTLSVEGKMEMRFLAEKIKGQNKVGVMCQIFLEVDNIFFFSLFRNPNFYLVMMKC